MRLTLLAPALLAVATAAAVTSSSAVGDRGSHGRFHDVAPAVYPREVACTTEPAPTAPIVKVRRSPRARLRLRVIGDGSQCGATWTATRAAPGSTDLSLVATPRTGVASACGTCVTDLLITRLGRGHYRVTLDGTSIRAHAP